MKEEPNQELIFIVIKEIVNDLMVFINYMYYMYIMDKKNQIL